MSTSHTHECRRWLQALCEYMDGELGEEMCAHLEQHLAECTACATVLETMRQTVTLYRRWGQAQPPEDLMKHLEDLVHRCLKDTSPTANS